MKLDYETKTVPTVSPTATVAPNTVTSALARLNRALESLDHLIDTTLESKLKARSANEEVQRMAEDRSKLARELDGAEARAIRLSETNKEVSRRLVGAMETVRDVLDKNVK